MRSGTGRAGSLHTVVPILVASSALPVTLRSSWKSNLQVRTKPATVRCIAAMSHMLASVDYAVAHSSFGVNGMPPSAAVGVELARSMENISQPWCLAGSGVASVISMSASPSSSSVSGPAGSSSSISELRPTKLDCGWSGAGELGGRERREGRPDVVN